MDARTFSKWAFLIVMVPVLLVGRLTSADPHVGQSSNVVFIGGSTLADPCTTDYNAANNMGATSGGCLPVTGLPGELDDFTFTPLLPADVSAAALAPYEKAVLNMASRAMACNSGSLSAQQQADLVTFVEAGNKLIIFDSECRPVDYSWLPYPFYHGEPGCHGCQGHLDRGREQHLVYLGRRSRLHPRRCSGPSLHQRPLPRWVDGRGG